MRPLPEARAIVAALSSFLSVAGCLTILLTYYCYKDLKRPARKLLLFLSIADLGTALNYLINLIVCGGVCEPGKGGPTEQGCHAGLRVIFAYVGVYFPVASFLWTSAIALFVYLTAKEPERDVVQIICDSPLCKCFSISSQSDDSNSDQHKRFLLVSDHQKQQIKRMVMSESTFFSLICWTFPLVNCLGLAMYSYGMYHPHFAKPISGDDSGGWCWVHGLSAVLIGGKSVEILSYGFIFCMYWQTYKLLRKRKVENEKRRELSVSKRRNGSNPNNRVTTLNHSPNSGDSGSGNRSVSSRRQKKTKAQAIRDHQQLCKDVAALRNEWKMNELLSRLLLIPAIFIFIRSWGTIRMILNLSKRYRSSGIDSWMGMMQAFCDPSQGFFNGVLFVAFVTPVRIRLKGTLKRYCCCECGYFCLLRSFLCCECLACCACWWAQYGTPFGPRHAFRREVTRQIQAAREAHQSSTDLALNLDANANRTSVQELSDHGLDKKQRHNNDLFEDTPAVQHGNTYLPATSTEGKIRELRVSSACLPSSFQPLKMTISSAPSILPNNNNNDQNGGGIVRSMHRDYGSNGAGSSAHSGSGAESAVVGTGDQTGFNRYYKGSMRDSSDESTDESSTEVVFGTTRDDDDGHPSERSQRPAHALIDSDNENQSSVSTMSLDDDYDESDLDEDIETTTNLSFVESSLTI